MKLWYSFIKELKLASRGFFFYVELVMALIFLVILLVVIPENFDNKSTEYLYSNLPEKIEKVLLDDLLDSDLDGQVESVEIKSGGEVYTAQLYVNEGKKAYIFEDEETVIRLAEEKQEFGAIIELDDEGNIHYRYYMQGYESERMKNVYKALHNKDLPLMKEYFDAQDVRPISSNYEELSDREYVVPSFLTFNGSLMGFFILVAYIFLDKKEGVIKAYAVTASSVWHYLISKIGVVLVVSIVTSLIMIIPVMGAKPNYLLLFVFLLTTGFFASSLGLLVASFYKNMMNAFGIVYLFIIAFMLPNIAYFIPSWEPAWMKIIPSHYMINGFKEIILRNGDASYVLMASFGFFAVGLILFLFANVRYKKTLTA